MTAPFLSLCLTQSMKLWPGGLLTLEMEVAVCRHARLAMVQSDSWWGRHHSRPRMLLTSWSRSKPSQAAGGPTTSTSELLMSPVNSVDR